MGEKDVKLYRVQSDPAAPYTGDLQARSRWEMPCVRNCPGCGTEVWGNDAIRYPCVDLTGLPNLREFDDPSPQPLDVYLRLCAQLRPLLPAAAVLRPGMGLGPIVGRASGSFGQLFMQNPWSLYMRREALERLQEAGVRGLHGCPTELRFRGKNPPELLEPQLELRGELHADCLPADAKTCEQCGVKSYSLPDPYLLDAATLPTELDLFRLAGWTSVILATERFVEAVKRLGLDGVTFREVPVR
jgi:uncharacterized double-CXXCG motif protein